MTYPKEEVAMILYYMKDADSRRATALSEDDRMLQEQCFKIYKRALWDALSAYRMKISDLFY